MVHAKEQMDDTDCVTLTHLSAISSITPVAVPYENSSSILLTGGVATNYVSFLKNDYTYNCIGSHANRLQVGAGSIVNVPALYLPPNAYIMCCSTSLATSDADYGYFSNSLAILSISGTQHAMHF
jgi:uncharacterized PurR-regulated membrane protein YhhQ (DUF165 family)